MITNYFSYKVKIRASQFISSSGREYENTARLSFFDDNKKELAYVEAGYIDTEDLFKMIDEGAEINVDDCFVENFSLCEYRKSRKKSNDEPVRIESFSAHNAFFDAAIVSDFSFAVFGDGKLNFKGAHFINGKVSFNSARFGNGDEDFSYVYFNNGNVDFANVVFNDGNMSFKNAVFGNGHKDFQYADFGTGNIQFVNTEFGNGDVSFINSNFSAGDVSFKVARFGLGKVDFHFSTFGDGDISFERAEFGEGGCDFRKVEFQNGKVNFNRAIFGEGEINFEASSLSEGRITFKKTNFGKGNINFEIAEFDRADLIFEAVDFGEGNVSFHGSKFRSLSLKSCHLDHYFDLRVSKCNDIDLSDTIVRDIIDVQPYKDKVEIGHFNITGMRLLGRIDIDWIENNVTKIIVSQENTSLKEKAEQFRILKENYGSIGHYIFEDEAYIMFKRYEQKSVYENAIKTKPSSRIIHAPVNLFKTVVFDKMGLYATSPARVLLSLIIVYLTFSAIHFILPFLADTSIGSCLAEDAGFFVRLRDTLYYSLITFTTVGYGDCSPFGVLRIVAAVEGFFGVFMMSYFTVAFARKILR